MKKTLMSALAFIFVSNVSYASGISSNATVISVEPVYHNTVPIYEKHCYISREQVYSSNSGDVFAGIVIGGLVGKGLTGKDDGAAIGAILGGLAAADKPRGVYYQNVQRCENTIIGYEKTINHYLVTYRYNGELYQEKTYRSFVVGQKIPIE